MKSTSRLLVIILILKVVDEVQCRNRNFAKTGDRSGASVTRKNVVTSTTAPPPARGRGQTDLEIQPSACRINLKEGFGIPSPVFIYKGEYMLPNNILDQDATRYDGTVTLLNGAKVFVACPGSKVKLGKQLKTEVLPLQCESGATFKHFRGSWRGELKEVSCKDELLTVEVSSENKGLPCGGQGDDGGKMVTVGYAVRTEESFKNHKKLSETHELYEACFNSATKRTLYVKHELPPSSFYTQNQGCETASSSSSSSSTPTTTTRRPPFMASLLFGTLQVDELYGTDLQKQSNTLKSFVNTTEYLTRGHLAPCADFPLRALQRATYHYVNAAPQWKSLNNGDWKQLEEALRRHVKETRRTLTVYTGTHGQLSTSESLRSPGLYLADKNNNNVIPVPLYFYKVVYHNVSGTPITATVFVSINYSAKDVRMERVPDGVKFCEDVCRQVRWLTWGEKNKRSFCCSYADFTASVNNLNLGLEEPELYVF